MNNTILQQIYNQAYQDTMVKLASTRMGDDKMIRDEEWHDYLVSPSDRAGEIEAALDAQGTKTEGISEFAATHPALFSALSGLTGAAVGGAGTYLGEGARYGFDHVEPEHAGVAALIAGALGSLAGNAYAVNQQGKLISNKVKAPTSATKKKLLDEVESGNPNVLPLAGGFASGMLPGVSHITIPMGMADRGRNTYAKKVVGDPLSIAERNPKTTAILQALLASGVGSATWLGIRAATHK